MSEAAVINQLIDIRLFDRIITAQMTKNDHKMPGIHGHDINAIGIFMTVVWTVFDVCFQKKNGIGLSYVMR